MFHLTCYGWLIFRAPSYRTDRLADLEPGAHVRAGTLDVPGLLCRLRST
jgi:hypothetical protein